MSPQTSRLMSLFNGEHSSRSFLTRSRLLLSLSVKCLMVFDLSTFWMHQFYVYNILSHLHHIPLYHVLAFILLFVSRPYKDCWCIQYYFYHLTVYRIHIFSAAFGCFVFLLLSWPIILAHVWQSFHWLLPWPNCSS